MTGTAPSRTPPIAPNWPELTDRYGKGGLLTVGASLDRIRKDCRWRAVYLATPFDGPETQDDDGGYDRIGALTLEIRTSRWCRVLALAGISAVSPVMLRYSMICVDDEGELDPLDCAFWADWARRMLRKCEAVIVPPIPGWTSSASIWAAVIDAIARNIPAYLLEDCVLASL